METTITVCLHNVRVLYDISAVDDLSDDLYDDLVSEAEDRAAELIPEGYHSGELNCATDDAEIRGWWEVAD